MRVKNFELIDLVQTILPFYYNTFILSTSNEANSFNKNRYNIKFVLLFKYRNNFLLRAYFIGGKKSEEESLAYLHLCRFVDKKSVIKTFKIVKIIFTSKHKVTLIVLK